MLPVLAALAVLPVPPPMLVGDALPPGAVARLGPQAFRYGGWVNVLHFSSQTVWYSPDGKRVGVTSNAGVYVWDAATGKRLLWVPGDLATKSAILGFHPDGDVFVTRFRAGNDDAIGVYRIDPATGTVKATFRPPDRRIFIAATPDGKLVLSRTTFGIDGETVADDPTTGREVWRRKEPEKTWMKPSADGSRVVVWSSRSRWDPEVLDAATGKTVERFSHPHRDSHPAWNGGGVAVGPKADVFLGAHGWDCAASVFRPGSAEPRWQAGSGVAGNVFVTGDGKKAVVVRGTKTGQHVEAWDLEEKKVFSTASVSVGSTLALSPDGTTLAAAADYRTAPHTLHFFDVATGKKKPFSPEPFRQAAVVWYLPDGTLASADERFEGPVKWNLKTGAMTPLPAGTKPPAAPKPGPDFRPPVGTGVVAIAPDGRRVLGNRDDPDELDSVPGDTYLGLFDAAGRVLRKYGRPDYAHGAASAFAQDGKTFAVARGDGSITLFDATDGTELRVLRHGGSVWSLAYSPDGRHLATGCGDGPILVWGVGTKP